MDDDAAEKRIAGEDEAGSRWAQGIAQEWAADLDDPRQDLYAEDDGQPVRDPSRPSWVCEDHPDQPAGHLIDGEPCGGAGMPADDPGPNVKPVIEWGRAVRVDRRSGLTRQRTCLKLTHYAEISLRRPV